MRLNLVVVLVAGIAPGCSCGGDCDVSDASSCGPGLLCRDEGGARCVPGCLADSDSSCPDGQACEAVEGATDPLCFPKVFVQGQVLDALSSAGLAGARVAARDSQGAVTDRVALSGVSGLYSLPMRAARRPDGSPAPATYTLRAEASGYATFPGGPRPALPIDLAWAVLSEGKYAVQSAATSLALLPLPAASRGAVSGRVDAPSPGGTLVVAGAATGVADSAGDFTVFNVPAGAATVRGYLAGVALSTAEVTVPAAGEVTGVVLAAQADKPLASVSGSVNIVNAPGGSTTSVVLAVEDTFNATLEIGEVPRGLRATGVSNAYSIAGVPDGKYVILASLDNDGLVRDPNPKISGTQMVHLVVTNGVPSVSSSSFKVTGALAVVSPGANGIETVGPTPVFTWADDSSEDGYAVKVFDSLGNLVWERTDVPSVSGGGSVQVTYGGPALTTGMVYQFRAVSLRGKPTPDTPISRTEELRGVFNVR